MSNAARKPAVAWLRRLGLWLIAPAEKSPLASVIVALTFGLALTYVHAHHEFWRDEIHSWGVGKNARGLWGVIFGNRRYEGHPFLWYYLLNLVSRLFATPLGLHVITVALTTVSTYLWFRLSGFPRFLRLLVLTSYLWFYEYGVMSRCYTLGITLVCIFCAIYRRERPRYVVSGVLLSLLAVSSVYGTLMSGVLALFLFTRGVRVSRKVGYPFFTVEGISRAWALGLAVFILGAVMTGITSRMPDDCTYGTASTGWTTSLGIRNLRAALGRFWWAMVPTSEDWWSQASLGCTDPALVGWIPWFGGALFVAFLISLRSAPILIVVYALGITMMALFQEMRYPGGLRHVGHFLILLLACGWLLGRDSARRRRLPLLWVLLSFALVFQITSAVRSTASDLRRPFSGSLEAANFLRPMLSDDAHVIGHYDHQSSAVAGYLDRPFLFATTGDYSKNVIFHNRRHGVDNNVLFDLASTNLAAGYPVYFVLTNPLSVMSQGGLTATLLHVTAPAIVVDEQFWIYRVERLDRVAPVHPASASAPASRP